MKETILILALLCTYGCYANDGSDDDEPTPPEIPEMTEMEKEDIIRDQSRRMNNFSLNFHRKLHMSSAAASPNTTDNMVFSPYSIYNALAMLALGANENTKDQIYTALNWNNEKFDSLSELSGGISDEGSNYDTKLDVANNAWSALGSDVLVNFQNEMESNFGVQITEEDFTNTESARTNINEWVRENTGDRIVELFKASEIRSDTKIVLANAIYFKGHWNKTFKEEDTQAMNFTGLNQEIIPNVPFMFQNEKVRTTYHRNILLLELPYGSVAEAQFTMLLAKPEDPTNIWGYTQDGSEATDVNQLCEQLNEELFNTWMENIDEKTTVESDIFLPRFTVKHGIDLREKLQLVGISEVFTGDADLSGITGYKGLFVSSAKHQAMIEVDEEGTEAAAATALGVTLLMAPPTVYLDQPFIFFIINKRCNTIIFAGKVTNPLR